MTPSHYLIKPYSASLPKSTSFKELLALPSKQRNFLESLLNNREGKLLRQMGRRRKPSKSSPLPKALNLNTYKFHALGDYALMIKTFGTTDSYTTQVVHY